MDKLLEVRKEIEKLDKELALLFEARMKLVKEVALYKKTNNLEVFDSKREVDLLEKNSSYIKETEFLNYYKMFLTDLMNTSKEYQRDLLDQRLIAYQGTKGAFSYLTAKKLFKHSELNSYNTFEDVFLAVENKKTDYGVLPIENSFTGEITEVLDLLFKYNLNITKIYDLHIDQNLVGIKGAKISDILEVYSHPQAISQSQMFLKARDFKVLEYANTALAAKYVSETNDKTKAAIASSDTANLYNLDIICEKINTSENNKTRFIVISKELPNEGNCYSVIFTTQDKVGALASIIQEIAKLGFSMDKIISRPTKDKDWGYYFYVELRGSINNKTLDDLLAALKNKVKIIKIVGSYYK